MKILYPLEVRIDIIDQRLNNEEGDKLVRAAQEVVDLKDVLAETQRAVKEQKIWKWMWTIMAGLWMLAAILGHIAK